jgi:hypothetical protein
MDPIFLPSGGLGVRIEATDASQRAELVGDGDTIIATNMGSVAAYICYGRSDVEATTACYPILPRTKEDGIMLRNASGSWVAAICDTGQSTTILFHRVAR